MLLMRTLRRAAATVSLVLVLVPSPQAQEGPAAPEGAKESPTGSEEHGVQVTYLANAGFLLESAQHSVLIDALLRDPTESYSALPPRVYGQLVNARAPFDRPMRVLVSHRHDDHVQMRSLEKFLKRSPQSTLFASSQVILTLKREAQDFAAIRPRIRSISGQGKALRNISQDGLRIDFFELSHVGAGNEKVVNIAHLIEMGGVKILHVGDAVPLLDRFSQHELGSRDIDVAILPYWFLGSDRAISLVRDWLRPAAIIVCHIPMVEQAKAEETYGSVLPNTVVFGQSLEKRRFLPGGVLVPVEHTPESIDTER